MTVVDGRLVETTLLLVAYLAVVSAGGYLLGRASEALLERVQARIVGGVLLGFVDTLPEYLLALISTLLRHNDVAVGSAFGGNIFLFTVPLGLLYFFTAKEGRTIKYGGLNFDLFMLGASTALILAASALGSLDTYVGLALIALYAVFLTYSAHDRGDQAQKERAPPLKRGRKILSAAIFGLGLALSTLFIRPLVGQVVLFSNLVGVPPIITSFTLVPAADELPELIAMFTLLSVKAGAQKTREGGRAAFANLIGSKVQSNTLLIGTVALSASALGQPIIVSDRYSLFTLYAMAATTFMGIAVTLTSPTKAVGVALMVAYVAIISAAFIVGL